MVGMIVTQVELFHHVTIDDVLQRLSQQSAVNPLRVWMRKAQPLMRHKNGENASGHGGQQPVECSKRLKLQYAP